MSARPALAVVADVVDVRKVAPATHDTGQIWFDTKAVSSYAGCHVVTARLALESGELHGLQRKAGGRWRIHRDCLNSWCAGERCAHQLEAASS